MVRIVRNRLTGILLALALLSPAGTGSAETVSPLADSIGGPFELIDHNGVPVTEADFHGRHLLVFFGYANCPGICSAALPLMAQAIDALGDDADLLQPVLITVDPAWDTPPEMKRALAKIHPRLLGLTGTMDQLTRAHAAYQVKFKLLGEDWNGNPMYSHGSYIYLMGPDGEFETLMPPVLAPEKMAEIIESYL